MDRTETLFIYGTIAATNIFRVLFSVAWTLLFRC